MFNRYSETKPEEKICLYERAGCSLYHPKRQWMAWKWYSGQSLNMFSQTRTVELQTVIIKNLSAPLLYERKYLIWLTNRYYILVVSCKMWQNVDVQEYLNDEKLGEIRCFVKKLTWQEMQPKENPVPAAADRAYFISAKWCWRECLLIWRSSGIYSRWNVKKACRVWSLLWGCFGVASVWFWWQEQRPYRKHFRWLLMAGL